MARGYAAGIYRGDPPYRDRWAVLGPTGCWHFPTRYGKKAAYALAARLNREAL